jgi:hypothetical protein
LGFFAAHKSLLYTFQKKNQALISKKLKIFKKPLF